MVQKMSYSRVSSVKNLSKTSAWQRNDLKNAAKTFELLVFRMQSLVFYDTFVDKIPYFSQGGPQKVSYGRAGGTFGGLKISTFGNFWLLAPPGLH